MKNYTQDAIRNVALLGHMGTGKTMITEAVLLKTGVTNRLGTPEEKNTVSDYTKVEKGKGYSVSLSMVPVEYKDTKINFIDTPGFFDFEGEVASALGATGTAAIVVDATEGIQVGTEKAWEMCKRAGVPKFFVISKIDAEGVNVENLIAQLKAKFGNEVASITDKEALDEAIAGTDEELMEIYFDKGEFTDDQFKQGLYKGIDNGEISPVFACSAKSDEGITELLDAIVDIMTRPIDGGGYFVAKNGEGMEIPVDVSGEPILFVFKTLADAFLGKISLAKVISGKITHGMELYNHTTDKAEKLGSIFYMRGNEQIECTEADAGDIVAIGKLQNTRTNDVLASKGSKVIMSQIPFPKPNVFKAIEVADKSDDEKLISGLRKLQEEDPTISIDRNLETHQIILGGQGEVQLGIVLDKMKEKYGVEITEVPKKIAYRETIKGSSDVQGKHKKQSGGAGQYGDVHIRFSPAVEEFDFSEELFGGSVPKQYVPAVEKGLKECMEKGPLTGSKVVNIKAVLYDGSYHDVDSNEMAFKIAAALAFKKGIAEAKPCLLEPVMKVKVTVPDSYMGDVMGDLNRRRGKIQGMEPATGGMQILTAEVPEAEMGDYGVVLRTMTQARATFEADFERYDEVPAQLAEQIIAQHQSEE